MTFSMYSSMIDKAFNDLTTFFEKEVPIEVEYKGYMHKISKYVQETAMDGVGCFV